MDYQRYIAFRRAHAEVHVGSPLPVAARIGSGALVAGVALILMLALPSTTLITASSTAVAWSITAAWTVFAIGAGLMRGGWEGALLAFEAWYFGVAALVVAVGTANL